MKTNAIVSQHFVNDPGFPVSFSEMALECLCAGGGHVHRTPVLRTNHPSGLLWPLVPQGFPITLYVVGIRGCVLSLTTFRTPGCLHLDIASITIHRAACLVSYSRF